MSEQLSYEIHKYSSYSTSYLPENIREDCPSNQTSRWSSNTNSPPQFLTLKLQRPAIVKTIKFGKYEKTHVCNLRKFKIFGGLEEEHMVLLFEGGLKNDSVPETFTLRHTTDSGELLPVLFIQIMPLLSWGPSFNFSIWYVELQGQDDPIFVRTSLQNYNTLREVEIVRLCLKHFRQQGYESAFRCLQDQTNVLLEHPMMSNLHDALVIRGDFQETEGFMEQCVEDGLLDGYLARQDYKASWELQDVTETENRPGMRGGHQLVIDNQNGLIYLYGGWDGFEDLSDLWCYSIKSNVWRLIHANSEKFDGPTPRSCHKMVFDPRSGQIFILGRYLDSSSRTKEHIKSEFYLYDTTHQSWLQICDDTSQVCGPQLIFDHQMCIDVDKQTIYVFGGRILTPRNIDDMSNDPQYSGLFSYHIGTNTWTQLLVDCGHPTAAHFDVPSIKSRVTHSMVFHHRHRKLYIFGGQRNKEYTTDFVAYDVDTGELSVVNVDSTAGEKNVPQSGFTQRATIDCDRDEIYVLSSLSKEKERRDLNVNSLWLYSLKTNEWTCIYKCDHSTENCCSNKNQVMCSEPCPRYAHQLVYDATNRIHYLFGGNPGRNTLPQLRLDDFWVLRLDNGLKNDSVPETFTLRHTTDSGELLPVLFIQIMPLLSWGPSFNFSIWYVELQGQDDPIFVRTSLQNYNTLREVEIVRLCLKHFRQQGYESAFRCLQDQTNVLLEHPMMSNLHDALVIRGDFQETEGFMEQCVEDGLLDGYLARQDYKASWELQDVTETENRPGMRGGHQLVIDNQNGLIYLYGGWDGFEDLSDLWCYSIKSNVWRLIHANSEKFDGPTPRSCHKMVFDPRSGQIFILGRYLDSSSRTKEHIKSEFYLYDTTHQSWLQICDDTSQVCGPQLIFDHQMCIDVDKQTIYVFGGRILTPRNIDDMSNDPQYSGLFSYHIGTNTWTQLLVDCGHPTAAHFDLYIFGGQRNKEYTTDFVAYDVDTGELSVVNVDSTAGEKNVPQSGFTQRATIDCDRDEIYVLSSLSKEKERRDLNVNSLWLYSLKTNEWTCIYKCDHSTENCCSNKNQVMCSEPCPRYAHQLVYDATNRIHYLFGGNPGRNTLPQLRLDDFWVLRLDKPSRQQILRHCKYLIRRLEYEEITKSDPLKAVNYLQTRLHDIIDHKDPEELKEFHKLASLLFKCDDFQTENNSPLMTVPLGTTSAFLQDKTASSPGASTTTTPSPSSSSSSTKMDLSFNVKNQRYLLFNKLVKLLPENMVQPKGNLSDFVLI
uniref:Muskelin N-terminal domain-containing protein n=2 Tax=Lutzomyia longipalpis TaxID=7200 RepID=A0A1B0CC51_LUTLO